MKKRKNHSRRNEKKIFLLLYFEESGVLFFDTKKSVQKEQQIGMNMSARIYTKEDENVYILHFLDEFPFQNFYNH